jgi:hypothetical protein
MNVELAKRAVACKHWQWLPGMLIQNADGPVRIDAVDGTQPGVLRKCHFTNEVYVADVRSGPLPDLSDPCTLGGLLALLRGAWGRPMLVAYYAPLTTGQGWYVGDRFCGGRDYPIVETPSATEEEALVAALEAAP